MAAHTFELPSKEDAGEMASESKCSDTLFYQQKPLKYTVMIVKCSVSVDCLIMQLMLVI